MQPYSAFTYEHRVAEGSIAEVAVAVKAFIDDHPDVPAFIFDNRTGNLEELDFRGSVADVAARLEDREDAHVARRGKGRPRLGVMSREVTLKPSHWAWLQNQRGSASEVLRYLVDQAMRSPDYQPPYIDTSIKAREAQMVTYTFMTAIGGDFPGYEEALRALYAKDEAGFVQNTREWPEDIGRHALHLAAAVWSD